MKRKFKEGDRVKVVEICLSDLFDTNVRPGMIGTICNINKGKHSYIADVKFDETIRATNNNWNEKEGTYQMFFEQLELIEEETIVIYRKGQEVIALDESTGKKAAAKCSPSDKFDFKAGAKLAFERLMVEEVEEKIEQVYNGKIVFTRCGIEDFTVGKIYEIKDGKIRNNKGDIYPLHMKFCDFEHVKKYFGMMGDYRPRYLSIGNFDLIEVHE